IGKALDDGDNLRILPVLTYGAVENVSDLLYMHGVDVAITYADDLDQFKKSGAAKNIDQRINYISELFEGELHIYARPEIRSLADLEARKLDLTPKGPDPPSPDRSCLTGWASTSSQFSSTTRSPSRR